VKLISWVALNEPKRLAELDSNLAFPSLLTEQDILDIIDSGNSIFWEHNPNDLNLFDYAYLDRISGLVYSNRLIKPECITFPFSAMPEDRLYDLQEINPGMMVVDYLYVSIRI